MREEYNIKELNPRKNPYTNRLKKQITMYIDNDAVEYFKKESQKTGLPYQTLINLYLSDCASKKRKLNLTWQ